MADIIQADQEKVDNTASSSNLSADKSTPSDTTDQGDENIKSSDNLEDLEAQDAIDNTIELNDPNTLERLESLSKTLSHKTANDSSEVTEQEFDLEQVLRRYVDKQDAQGIKLRHVGIYFKNLTATGIDQAASFAPTIGDFFRTLFNLPYYIHRQTHLPTRQIIEDVSGLVKTGEMLLVLGRPGSGCTTILKCLAGEIDQFKSVEGSVSYDGIDQKTMMRRFRGDVLYNAELDVHFPSITVDQTLSFAIECRTPRIRIDNLPRKEFTVKVRDVLATVFGLTHTFNTKVGNDYVRGVSGGERKRVSLAEAMAARPALVSWDNATRGLDSSTALEYAQTIRTTTNLLQNVALVAIYQAGEHIYELFDKVTVLYSGKQIFFGPANKAKEYFEKMGYDCPPRQTTAEFLTSITDPQGRFFKPGMELCAPKTASEFATYWKASPEYAELQQDIEDYASHCNTSEAYNDFKTSAKQEKMKSMIQSSPFTISYRSQFVLCVRRGVQRIIGDSAYMFVNMSSTIVQSLIIGSLFYNIPDDVSGAFSRGGILFFATLFVALTSMAEITSAYAQRPIVLKQKLYGFYHPSAEALASLVSDLPVKIFTSAVFDVILYFLSNLNRTAGQFFYFLMFTFMVTFTMKTFFQLIAATTTTIEVANAIAGVGLLALSMYAGYVIPRPSMHPWFKWISYINPIAYGFENLMVNEFHGRRMDCASALIPQGSPVYEQLPINYKVCAITGSRPGLDYVLGDDYLDANFQYEWHNLWRNFGIIIAFWVAMTVAFAVVSEVLRPVSGGGDVLVFVRTKETEKKLKDMHTMTAITEKKEVEVVDATDAMKPLEGLDASSMSDEVFMWQHVDYTIPIKGGHRKLLDDVQGYVKPGSMTALIGESGAGKTTLLNILAQRVDFGVITGDMLVNGKPLDQTFQRRTGYVQQQDLHVAQSTVREALRFAAVLRQPKSVKRQEKYAYVETVIQLLGMEDYAEAIIGQPGRGLNVEQRKKLSIGVELAAKPNLLLFLDEPTSGLDSQSAWAIVMFLRRLANAGQSILCTIHQPSATLFEQFDRLLLLKKGGQTVYFGDIGKNSESILDYFSRQGAPPCLPGDNPAEYILECIGAGATAGVSRDWHEVWNNSEDNHRVTAEISQMKAEFAQLPDPEISRELRNRFAASWATQVREMTSRTVNFYWRSPSFIGAKFALSTIGGLFIGFTFWDINLTIAGLQNGLFATFMAILTSVALINQLQPRLIELRELFEVRESASSTYHWSVLVISLVLVEIPYNIICGSIFFMCYYWPVGFFRNAPRAGYFYFVYSVLYQIYFTTFGLAVGELSPDASSASIIASLLFSFILSFCGVLQAKTLMPTFWTFMYYVSPLTYLVQSLLGTVLHGREVKCAEVEFSVFNPPPGYTCDEYAGVFAVRSGGYIDNLNATSECRYCRYSVADTYLESVGINYDQRWRNVGLLCAYIVFNTFAMFAGFYVFRLMKWRMPHPMRLVGRVMRHIARNFSAGVEPEGMVGSLSEQRKQERIRLEKKSAIDAGIADQEI
ncbi:ABC-2 type transporter-domain-containing protein [Lipomyces arxii]|uniref:ABC-2 type transporter-domain-containing protein n=1 Tax=Lipomyces arxii TaxID=56418 RepID=UPI0034CED69C